MNKEQQNLAWACLPKEVRDYTKRIYQYECEAKDYNDGANDTLESIFGKHNLTSDTEPEELLYCNKAKVQQAYKMGMWGNSGSSMLKYLFGDKCLPDPIQDTGFGGMSTTPPAYKLDVKHEQPSVQIKPKFRKEDKVRFKDSYYKEELHGKVGIIASVNTESECYVEVDNTIYCARESDIEPYTELETKESDTHKALYDALCELESASAKVRESLIALNEN